MAFWNRKKKDAAPAEGSEDVRGGLPAADSPAPKDPAQDKQRIKKIRNMKKKFDETVWNVALDTMSKEIPQFTIMEPDPDMPGSEIPKYVTLGFDTKIVDDFANKSDEDTGSFLTAVKSSMDCIIEYHLFDEELILMIPTARTLAALDEFEDVFNLKFFVVYVGPDHRIAMETKTPDSDDDFIFITLEEIRTMLKDNVYIVDQIDMLKGRAGNSPDMGGISGIGIRESGASPAADSGVDDAMSEEDYEDTHGPMDEEDGPPDEDGVEPPDDEDYGPPDEDGDAAGSVGSDDVRDAAGKAVKAAAPAGAKVSGQKDDIDPAARAASSAPAQAPVGGVTGPKPAAAAAAMDRIRSTVQKASDQAIQDPQIQQGQSAMAPQARPTFDMVAMDQYMSRKYYSDDLGLEISSQPFDSMFVQTNPFTPFDIEESDDWLDGYVNNLKRDANTRLARLHNENLLLMRKRFIMIVTQHAEAVTKAVATDNPNSRFGYALAVIQKQKEESLSRLGDQAAAYQKECEEAFQSRLQAEMENAAAVAKANFMNRYGRDHQRELTEIETDLKNNISSEYVAAVENLRAERRKEASRQLDAGISEALRICGDEYVKMMAQERTEYDRLQAVITNFVNQNMAADDARIRTLAEEQRRTNETVKVRSEYEAALELARKDFEASLAAAKAEIDRRDVEHENHVARVQDQYEHSMQELRSAHNEAIAHKDHEIGLLNDQLLTANAQLDELVRKYANLDHETGKKYQTQIDMLASERNAWNERADHLEKLHKYTDKIKITGVIIALAAALGIGTIIGAAIMSGAKNNQAAPAYTQQEPIIHYFRDGEEIDAPDGASQAGGDATPDGQDGSVPEGGE